MRLAPLLQARLIRCGLSASTKQEALEELVRLLVATEPGLAEQELLVALAEREKLGPFSMGKGVAFPHARTEKVKDFTIVLGTSAAGVDFRAPDGHKIRVAVLFAIPKKHSNLYLHTLAAFLNFFALEANFQRVVAARTADEVLAALDAYTAKPREGGPIEANGIGAVSLGTPLGKAIDALTAARAEALPVVDAEGNFVGQIAAATILHIGMKDHLLALASPASLRGGLGLEHALRLHADTPVEAIPGLIATNGFRTVQEDEPALDVAMRLARGGDRGAYVLKGRRLVGLITAADVLKKLRAER